MSMVRCWYKYQDKTPIRIQEGWFYIVPEKSVTKYYLYYKHNPVYVFSFYYITKTFLLKTAIQL